MTQAVPLTMVTGALGVGKTSALLDLAQHRPPDETWVVLVNELGEVGIDGALFDGGDSGLSVAELPGGCLCCSARGPMLDRVRRVLLELAPDRLLVEPSGVADPGKVLDELRTLGPQLELKAVVCLVDPRAAVDPELRRGAWSRQVQAAQVIVGNKVDCAGPETVRGFLHWAATLFPAPVAVSTTVGGELDPSWLDLPGRWPGEGSGVVHGALHVLDTAWIDTTGLLPAALGERLFRRAWTGPHHETCGWRLVSEAVFEHDAVVGFLGQLIAETSPHIPGGALRVKAVVCTDRGWWSVQASIDGTTTRPSSWRSDSRVEIIAAPGVTRWADVDRALLACLAEHP